MNAKHTPTPWRVDPMYPCDIQDRFGEVEVGWIYARAEPGKESVVGELSAPPSEEAKANCAFIVRAVNHHEALVEIVRVLTQAETDNPVAHMLEYGAACDRARALLAELDATPHTPASS